MATIILWASGQPGSNSANDGALKLNREEWQRRTPVDGGGNRWLMVARSGRSGA